MDGVLGMVLVVLGFLAMIFGTVYLNNKEKMAMIERGMDPGGYKQRPAPYKYLKWALLLIGAGVGLLLANIVTRTLLTGSEAENTAIYFSMIAICGGLGLLISYTIEKKELHERD